MLAKNLIVLNGPFELTGVNVYNARCWHGFIMSTHFVTYRDGEEDRMLKGNFLIKMKKDQFVTNK